MARGHNLGKVINYKISSFQSRCPDNLSQPVVSKHFQSEEINHQAHRQQGMVTRQQEELEQTPHDERLGNEPEVENV